MARLGLEPPGAAGTGLEWRTGALNADANNSHGRVPGWALAPSSTPELGALAQVSGEAQSQSCCGTELFKTRKQAQLPSPVPKPIQTSALSSLLENPKYSIMLCNN